MWTLISSVFYEHVQTTEDIGAPTCFLSIDSDMVLRTRLSGDDGVLTSFELTAAGTSQVYVFYSKAMVGAFYRDFRVRKLLTEMASKKSANLSSAHSSDLVGKTKQRYPCLCLMQVIIVVVLLLLVVTGPFAFRFKDFWQALKQSSSGSDVCEFGSRSSSGSVI